MTKLLQQFTKLFSTKEQSQLEQFINSKNPSNAADVEYWTREFETINTQYWGRGL